MVRVLVRLNTSCQSQRHQLLPVAQKLQN